MQQNHIGALDGLRGIAALIVVFSHLSLASWGRPAMFDGLLGAGAGQIGVMIFFVLSGFLMGYLYLPKPTGPISVLRFWQRRAARVLPLALLVFAYCIVVMKAFPHDWRLWAFTIRDEEILDYLTLRGYGTVLWTIAIECQFYLIFPLIWAAVRAFGPFGAALPVALIFFDRWTPEVPLPSITGWRVLGVSGHFFLGGVAIASLRVVDWKLPGWLWDAVFVSSAAGIFLLYPAVARDIFGWYDGMAVGQIGAQVWASPAYLCVCVALVGSCTRAPLASALSGAGFRWLGDISYSVYLLHMPVLWYLNRFTELGQSPWLFLVIGLGTVLLVSSAVYYGFERPMRRAITGIRPLRQRHAAPAE